MYLTKLNILTLIIINLLIISPPKQYQEMTGTNDNLPGATERPTPRASEKTELELFFGDLSSLNFTANKIKVSEIKTAIKNVRLSGLGLNVNTLIRFKDIAEDSVNLFIQNIEQNKNLDFRTALDTFRVYEEPEIFNYIQNLQTLPSFELIYKIFLILVSLINSYNLSNEDREQIFNQQYQEILKARPSNLFDGETKTAYDLAKNKINELKEVMPKNFYDSLFKKGKISITDILKAEPEPEPEPEPEAEVLVEVDENGNEVEEAGVVEQKQQDKIKEEDFEVESVNEDSEGESVETDDEIGGLPSQGAAIPELSKREITAIKRQAYNQTKKLINSEIKKIPFPVSQPEGEEIIKNIYEQALTIYATILQEANIILTDDEAGKKSEQILNLIAPVVQRMNNKASKSRKSSKKSQAKIKKGKGFAQDFVRELITSFI